MFIFCFYRNYSNLVRTEEKLFGRLRIPLEKKIKPFIDATQN